jgi:putative nucleotidyltransferase with HDIG domain
MEQFKEKAPGTFRHCEAVAQLTDAISAELDLDRVALYAASKLHDIGKMLNPSYFCENQAKGTNIHDKLSPEVSFQYISRHVSDGLLILINESCIPRKVLKIISQHHGNSPIRSLCTNDSVDCFRYSSKPPSSLEACVLMICDVVDATTKSLLAGGKLDDIEEVITTLLDRMIKDNQLNNLKIGELVIIKQVLFNEVNNLYHKRVEYKDTE